MEKVLTMYYLRSQQRLRKRTSKIKRQILRMWIKNVDFLLRSFVIATKIYTPRIRSIGSHHRSRESGADLLEKLNAGRFSAEFRISKDSFVSICNILREHLEPKWNALSSNTQKRASVEEKVAITLYKLKSCAEYQVIGNVFGYAKTTVHNIFYEVVEAIVHRLMHEYIKMPTAVEACVIANEFEALCGIPQVIGAIDCTHIPVTAPLEGRTDFTNRKLFTSLNLQAIVDHKLLYEFVFAKGTRIYTGFFYRFRNISCQFTGNVHDATVFKASEVFKRQKEVFPVSHYCLAGIKVPYLILGDPAYPLLP